MIGKLTGILEAIENDWIILDVGGVGYCVFLSERTRTNLPSLGSPVKLFIETHVRDDHIRLYGFLSLTEQAWFQALQTVQGVGVKVALAILSTLSHETLTQAIITENHALLTQVPGIGPKVAARIARELKDKIPSCMPLAASGSFLPPHTGARSNLVVGAEEDIPEKNTPLMVEALSALVNLGYSSLQAQLALRTALEEPLPQTPHTLETLIRSSLRYCRGA
jgi:Holliday junction DNA helicase RuvA